MISKKLLDKTLKSMIEPEPEIIKTGFHDLDFMLSNVDYGSLITIASAHAMGNTSFITSIIYNISKNDEKCLLFSIEFDEQKIIRRMLCGISEIPVLCFRDKNLLNDDMIKKLSLAKEEIGKLNLSIFDDIIDINQIKEIMEKEKSKYVFIDSIDLLCGFNEVVLNELKVLAKENDCIIFITCHLKDYFENRDDKRPILTDLRGVGRADIISDVVLFLYRECCYNHTKENKKIAEIIVPKNKNGSVGSFNLLFNGRFLRFYNMRQEFLDN